MQIEKPGTDGVLVAQGGANLGWTFFLQNGKLYFLLNKSGKRMAVVSEDAGVATAKELTASIGPKGLAKLSANGREIGRKHLQGLLPTQPIDGLSVGQDTAAPVGEYNVPFAFNGVIKSAKLEVGE